MILKIEIGVFRTIIEWKIWEEIGWCYDWLIGAGKSRKQSAEGSRVEPIELQRQNCEDQTQHFLDKNWRY